MKKSILTLIAVIVTTIAYAQHKKDVLLTLNDKPIYAQEFKKVYQKNLELVQDEEQKSVDGYLKLFVDYKLKVAEAYAQGLEKNEDYVKDFSKYEEQLSRNYIYEDNVTSDLVEEAYDRGLIEIDASHILIMCNWDAFPQDTLVAYNKIKAIRDRVLKGDEDFNALAKKLSEEPGANEREGRLDYFSVFAMVYPFETEAYNTPIGEVSNIVRTQFGYHIIKVHGRRPKLPQVTVSHIMISSRGDSTGLKSKERIDEIYSLLKQGASFEELAKKYSEDQNTGRNGGLMRAFTKGDLKAPPFEDASYALTTPGEISEPVQTRFGWHIIRLEKKHDLPTFIEEKANLERRIKDGERAKIITSAVTDKIKHKYGFQQFEYLTTFSKVVTDSIFKRKWKFEPLSAAENKKLFIIGDKTYYYNDFGKYVEERQGKVRPYKQIITMLKIVYDEFETIKIKEYFRAKLEEENEDYAAIINEYRDGLLIFEVMAKNVWDKAKNDSLGQKSYYETHKEKYPWKEHVEGKIYSTSNKDDMNVLIQYLNAGKSVEEIKGLMNLDGKVKVMVTSGVFEKGAKELPDDFDFKSGLSKIYEQKGTFTVVAVDKSLPAGIKDFEDVKGRVLSDYQNDLEKSWMEGLREKYTVKVDEKVLKRLKKELRS
jgi:peptidyl-prolyl cis-trans isomerase SurA